jgi:ferredoxin
MVRVRLEPAGMDIALAEGERLLDALDDQQHTRSTLPSACRAANCGACRVHVLAGSALLASAEAREGQLLKELGAAPDERLGCQLHAGDSADGLVVLRVIAA